jgi:6-phosphogluconate dehydrogenase
MGLKKIIPFYGVLIDGGNSFYKDSIKRNDLLKSHHIRFMDIGVSGGPSGAKNGACLMVGGEKKDFQEIELLIKAIAAPSAYGYFGKVGAGHFAKMVHNGIEYGMMEGIAEGAAVLKQSKYNFDLSEVFRVYNNRSVIESRLVEWTQEAFVDDQNLDKISSVIQSSGEGKWTIQIAEEERVSVPVIEKSFLVRQQSQDIIDDSPNGFRNKVVSAQRGKFGQHKVEKQ